MTPPTREEGRMSTPFVIDGRRTNWVKRRLQHQWDLLTSVGATCANIAYMSTDDIDLIQEWCQRLLRQRKEVSQKLFHRHE